MTTCTDLTQMLILFAPGIALAALIKQFTPWPWLYFLFRFPSTFAHELLHFLASLLTNGQAIGFTVVPRRVAPSTYTLGSVYVQTSAGTTAYSLA